MIIIIGASTGGPGHLKYIFDKLSGVTLPPVIIAQHMDAKIIPSFASHLGSTSQRNEHIVTRSTTISSGGLYVCQHSSRLSFSAGVVKLEVDTASPFSYNPSIDTLFTSAATLADRIPVLAILLTGIGDDGAEGLFRLYKAGAVCIAESEESAIVYGMPKKAYEYNPDVLVHSLDEIVEKVREFGTRYVV